MALLLTISLLTAALTVYHLANRNSRLGKLINKIPGPKGLPVIGNLLDFLITEDQLWPLVIKWMADYYSVMKFWIFHIPVTFVCHHNDIEILLSNQKNITKGFFYDLLHSWLNRGLLTSTGDKWRVRRKMLTPAFHYNVLNDFVGVFVETAERMVNALKEERGEVVRNVVPLFGKYMLSVICETAMGTPMQTGDPAQENYRKALKLVGETTFYRVTHPWLMSDWIFSLTRKGREFAEALETLHGFTSEIIDKRKRYHEETGGQYLKLFSSGNETVEAGVPAYDVPVKKKRLAMLDLLIATQKEHGTIDDNGIREEVDTFIFEGHDTTTMAVTFVVLQLAENKDIQARARAEIDSILKESRGKLTINELQNMTYLDRCIKESMRLFPAVYNVGRKLTDDMQLQNFVVPSGANVFISIYGAHRDPNVWPEPTVYDPDRFLPENIKNRHPFSYVPFSAGPRNCIGQKYAMLEMKAFLALLLHDFYFRPVIEVSKIRMIPDFVLKTAETLEVKFVPIR